MSEAVARWRGGLGRAITGADNTLGFEMFAEPLIGGEVADLFWCGPEDAASNS